MELYEGTLGKRDEKSLQDETVLTTDTQGDNDTKPPHQYVYKTSNTTFSSIIYRSPPSSPEIDSYQKTHKISLSSRPTKPREFIRSNQNNSIDIFNREPTTMSISMFSAPSFAESGSLADVHSLLKYLRPLDKVKAYQEVVREPANKTNLAHDIDQQKRSQYLLNDRKTFDHEIKSKCKKLEQAYSFLNHYYRHANRSDIGWLAGKSGLPIRVLKSWLRDKTAMLELLARVFESDPNSRNLL